MTVPPSLPARQQGERYVDSDVNQWMYLSRVRISANMAAKSLVALGGCCLNRFVCRISCASLLSTYFLGLREHRLSSISTAFERAIGAERFAGAPWSTMRAPRVHEGSASGLDLH
jgi:hypothetical protein